MYLCVCVSLSLSTYIRCDQTRDSKEALAREHLASLEDLRVRSTTELRDFTRELAAAGGELEKAREAARSHEGKASKLQVYSLGVART